LVDLAEKFGEELAILTARCFYFTVASRPKILQNNSKPAVEQIFWQRKIRGRTAAIFGEKRQKKFFV
jgi:hypothetical protein